MTYIDQEMPVAFRPPCLNEKDYCMKAKVKSKPVELATPVQHQDVILQ